MPDVYRVRCKIGKAEIEVESSDKTYVEAKLDELLQRLVKDEPRKPKAKGKQKHPKEQASSPAPAKTAPSVVVAPPAASANAVVAAPPPPKAKAQAAKTPAAKPAPAKKAAKPAKKAAKAAKPDKKAAKPDKKAQKKLDGKPDQAKALGPQELAQAIRKQSIFGQVQKNVLRNTGQLPRVLVCHYFADKLIGGGLTANQVELITAQLGARIASPNVAKVIRQQAKKFFVSERVDGVTRHRINRAGVTAAERLLQGKAL